jgi:PilX N-terminal
MRHVFSHRHSERGSALLLALLCVVLLTLIGIALAVITSGEVGIASNESDVNRSFYGAESGLGAGVAWGGANLLAFETMARTGTVAANSPFTTGGSPQPLVRTTLAAYFAQTTPTISVDMPPPVILSLYKSPDAGESSNLFTILYRLQSTATDTNDKASHAVLENLQVDNVKGDFFTQ